MNPEIQTHVPPPPSDDVQTSHGADTGVSQSGQTNEQGEPLRDGFATPNYGEHSDQKSVQNRAGVPDEFMNLFEHDPSEVILKQALKDPIGVMFIAGASVVACLVIVAGAMILLSDNSLTGAAGISAGGRALGLLIAVFLCALICGLAYAATIVYRKSRLILTNQKLVYIRYHSLFSREVSQLNIGEVEDVNVAQHTLWDRIFKMGTLTIETAGEQNNYLFSHAQDPHEFARLTIQAHEGSIAEYGN